MDRIRVGLIGHKFMGRAHTHAYTDLPIFFDMGVEVVKRSLCSPEDSAEAAARRWGWQKWVRDWRELVADPEIDLIDIAAPSRLHAEVSIASLRAGKHVFCEKPLALTIEDARRMADAAQSAGVVHMIGFNYRKVPALALAKKLIDAGEIGDIYHFRAIYQQGWLVDPGFPLAWRLRKSEAGYGSHGDLGAHVVDMARFLVGEITEVSCTQRTFITERPKPVLEDGLVAVAGTEKGTVDVDDASSMLLRFADRKTMGYIEVTRYGASADLVYGGGECIAIRAYRT